MGLLLRHVLEGLHWFTINVLLPGPPAMLDQLAGPRDGDKHHGFTSQGTLSGTLKDIGYTAEQVCFLFDMWGYSHMYLLLL